MQTISQKFQLIKEDIKSWATTSFLMLAPIALGQLIVFVESKNLGVWSSVVLLILGMLLKLAQKYSASTTY